MYPNITDQIATTGMQGINRLIPDMVLPVNAVSGPGLIFHPGNSVSYKLNVPVEIFP